MEASRVFVIMDELGLGTFLDAPEYRLERIEIFFRTR